VELPSNNSRISEPAIRLFPNQSSRRPFLAFLPLLAGRFRWWEAAAIVAGASAIAVIAFLALAAVGALGQFYMAMTVGVLIYTNIQSHSIATLVGALAWTRPLKGVRWDSR
jgi:hypothetical protein